MKGFILKLYNTYWNFLVKLRRTMKKYHKISGVLLASVGFVYGSRNDMNFWNYLFIGMYLLWGFALMVRPNAALMGRDGGATIFDHGFVLFFTFWITKDYLIQILIEALKGQTLEVFELLIKAVIGVNLMLVAWVRDDERDGFKPKLSLTVPQWITDYMRHEGRKPVTLPIQGWSK